ncbi:MAG: 3-dehydroquinate synthase [Anaerolineales bacterium]|nr:3-dehydroquinate synthase [Anaerolineales bacterium]
MYKIFLYGPSGSGKSTLGRLLAEQLDWDFFDVDAEIERTAGMDIPQIMAGQGEPAFRDLETSELKRAVSGRSGVISLGGGALLREENRRLVEEVGSVVFLDAAVDTLAARLQADRRNPRPLLAGELKETLANLLEKRKDHYASFSLRIATDNLTPEEISWIIQKRLGYFRVSGMGKAYEVIIQPGSLGDVGGYLQACGLSGPLIVAADSNVAPLYGDRVRQGLAAEGYDAEVIIFPAGESYKNLETVTGLWRDFLGAGLDRSSTVIAMGGGVVTDLVGFAAASFMRGLSWVALPTTLLGMVDASIGGKTGFDLPEGKNLVGAFYPPRLVLADPDALATLPERELRSGMAEAVKSGMISDPGLFKLCAASLEEVKPHLVEIVRRSAAVKVEMITADPYERGIRAALNLGHTLGHAVESVSGFALSHGEAVSIGLVAEARLAERMGIAPGGLTEEISVVLSGLGLPTRIPAGLSRQAILNTMKYDKKKAAGVVYFSLPVSVGEVKVGVEVNDLGMIFEE